MDTDDDMIMLIVGDDTDETQSIKVKEENEIDGQANNGESDGSIKEEDDYLEDDLDDDGDYLPKKSTRLRRSTKFYSPNSCKTPKNEKRYHPNMPSTLRRRMLKPSERKSYVQDLIKECPELKDNEQALIQILANTMLNTKPPTPPEGFYRIEKGTGQYVCETCEFAAANIGAISRHYQDLHGEMYLICYACGVNFRSAVCLYKHEKRCIAPDAVIVLKARAIAVGRKGRDRPFLPPIRRLTKYERHKELHNMKARLPCPYCPASFKDPRALDAHENLHRGERPYVCDYCMAPYGSYPALLLHRKTHEETSRFTCDYCGKTYKKKSTIKDHIQQRHSGEKKLVCEQCGKQFYQRSVMMRHIQKYHENLPPPCACQLCPNRYERIRTLRNHMRKEHGMELITRNMFIKSLPKLTKMELEQVKVVKKDELPPFPYVVEKANKAPKKNKKTKIETTSKTNKKAKAKIMTTQESFVKTELEEEMLPEPQTQTMPTAIQDEVVPTGHDHENENNIQQKVIVETIEEVSSDDSRMIVDISNLGLSADVLRFVQKIQAENKKEVVLVDHGKLVHLVDSESDALRLMEQLQYNDASVEIEDISKYGPESDEHQAMDPIEAQLRAMESGADTSKDKLSLRKMRKKKK